MKARGGRSEKESCKKNAEELQISVGDEQCKVTPTMCSTKCCSSDIAPDLTVDMVVTCATTATAFVEMVPAEDATSDAYIDNLEHPKKTLTNCSTNCSSFNVMTDLTVVVVERCATTVIAFVELIGIDDNGHTTCIGTSNPLKVMPTRCSTVVLNTNDDTV